jgi:hypothetical protein
MASLAINRWRESRILAGRYRTIAFKVPRTAKLTAILLSVVVGLIHLIRTTQRFRAVAYVGVLFVANFVGSLVAAGGFTGMRYEGGC